MASCRSADAGPQPRIDDRIEDVDHQVDGDENQRHQQQVGGHDRDVDILDRLHEQEPHARPLEHGLGDDGERDHRAELKSGNGDDRHQRVAQRVAEMDGASGQSTGSGEADIVGAQHLQHLRAHQPHDQRHLEQAQRNRRHDQRLQPRDGEQPGGPVSDPHGVAAPVGRQPAQRHRKQIDQQDADQERRQRNADQRHRLEQFCDHGIAPQRRIDPEQDAEHHGEHGGAGGELQRRRHPLDQEVRDRLAELIGHAELELHCVADITQELHDHGVVEAQRLADLRALRGGGVQRHHLAHRIAGKAEHRERNDADGEQHPHGLQCAAKRECEHLVFSPSP